MGRRRRLVLDTVAALVLVSLLASGTAAAATPGRIAETVGSATEIPYVGFDVSWPNCDQTLPSGRDFAVVGVTGGHPFSTNPCLARQFAVARGTGLAELYMNITAPNGATAGLGRTGPAGTCRPTMYWCRSYNYGYRAAAAAWSYAVRQLGSAGAHAPRWWLDVEFSPRWSSSPSVNAAAVAGALRYLESRRVRVGVYSTSYQWRTIVGPYRPRVAVWYATAHTSTSLALQHCGAAYGFTGGPVKIVQYTPGGLDADTLC